MQDRHSGKPILLKSFLKAFDYHSSLNLRINKPDATYIGPVDVEFYNNPYMIGMELRHFKSY
jgi:hypothetical protein